VEAGDRHAVPAPPPPWGNLTRGEMCYYSISHRLASKTISEPIGRRLLGGQIGEVSLAMRAGSWGEGESDQKGPERQGWNPAGTLCQKISDQPIDSVSSPWPPPKALPGRNPHAASRDNFAIAFAQSQLFRGPGAAPNPIPGAPERRKQGQSWKLCAGPASLTRGVAWEPVWHKGQGKNGA